MPVVPLNTCVDEKIRTAIEEHCRSHGVLMSRFVQEALLHRLDELDDSEDLKELRYEANRPFADVVRELGLDDERPR